MSDEITIKGLKVMAQVGVPEEERALAQRLVLNVVLIPAGGFAGMGDDVGRTIDYDLASRRLRSWCDAGEWALIETLAEELATKLLDEFFLLERVEVEVRKFVIPDSDHVAVRVVRLRDSGAR
ncbi:MAG: dihydroneopterin aldolase [Verrucomicrobiota bacterium]